LKVVPLWSGTKQGFLLLARERNKHQEGREGKKDKLKLILFQDEIILYNENSKHCFENY
jgi:hypothetical protein